MAVPDRRIVLAGLIALALAVGMSGLHLDHAGAEDSAESGCTACALAQTPSTVALDSVPLAAATCESRVKVVEQTASIAAPSQARVDTTRGPPQRA